MAIAISSSARQEKNSIKPLKKMKDDAAKARSAFDKDVLLNLAFYLDEQYVEWVGDYNSLRRMPYPQDQNPANTPRPVANKIMHFCQQEHSMALQNDPQPDVQPATDDPLDISVAQVSKAYLEWLASPNVGDFSGELSDATLWALVGGEGFFKWFYSEKLGRPDFMSVSPLDLYMDPYARRFGQARYVCHSQFVDVEQVYELYGEDVKPEQQDAADKEKSQLLREMGEAAIVQGAIINELWIRPSRRHKDGVYTVWVGDKYMIPPDKFPYQHKQLPFSQIGTIQRPGNQHYTCAVKYLRAPQMELNKYHQQRIMVREAFANPKWWIPDELELESDPNDSPRQILRGNSLGGTMSPQIIQPTVFPENSDGDWIVAEMQDVVGLHEISQGQVPGRVESARAIESLKEADDSRLAELTKTTKAAMSQGFWQLLMLTKQYVTDDVIVETYSREGLPEVKRFKAEQLKPGMKVNITMGTGLGNTRAAKMDSTLALWNAGVIQDPEIVAGIIDVPLGVLEPQKSFDIRLARNENMTLAQDKAITPNSWDEHEIHLREHNNHRKTSEYAGYTKDIKQKFEFHCQTHDALWNQELEKKGQRAQLQAAAGQVPGDQHAPPKQTQ